MDYLPDDRQNDHLNNVVPLNPVDDPFITLRDNELQPDNIELQTQYVVRLLVEDLSRGMYSIGRLREKYVGEGNYRPYPWLTLDMFNDILELAVQRIIDDNPIDVRFEIMGYFSSNLRLQESLYDMKTNAENAGQTRTVIETVKTLNQLKKERLDFMRSIGMEISQQAADPSRPSMVPPGSLPVTDLLAQGAKILERTDTPDNFKGILTSGDLAQERGSGSSARNMETQQDPVDTAGIIPE